MSFMNERELRYKNIMSLPHYTSATRPRMTSYSRAAQFSAFAALTGYDAAVLEISRYTEAKKLLDENRKEELDLILQNIKSDINNNPRISLIYFKKDNTKPGGKYIRFSDNIKSIDYNDHLLIFNDNFKIKIDDIYDISYPI